MQKHPTHGLPPTGSPPMISASAPVPRPLASLALLLAVLLAAGCGHHAAGEGKAEAAKPLPVVQVGNVTRGTLKRLLPATGTLQALPSREATLTPPVSGVLDGLLVHYGQTVQKGQTVARLGVRQLLGQIQQAQATLGQNQVQVQQAQANALQQAAQTRTSILQAQASLQNARATLAGADATLTGAEAALLNARQTLSRERTLYADGLVPQKDVEAAALSLRTAAAQRDAQRQTVAGQRQTVSGQQAAVSAARAAGTQDFVKRQDVLVARQQVRNALGALAAARAQIALYTLHAPLSGQVTSVGATAGETVDTTTKVAVIADLSVLQLRISVPGDAATQVHRGQPVLFSVGSLRGRTFRATVDTVSSSVDAATGTVPVLALVSNPGHLLRDDTVARVQILTERRDGVLLVPQSAVLADPDTGKPSVVSVGADGAAHVVPVSVGLTTEGRVEITDGLTEGQPVAVSGQYGLPDGTKVQAQKAPDQAAPAAPPAEGLGATPGGDRAPGINTQAGSAPASGGSNAPAPTPSAGGTSGAPSPSASLPAAGAGGAATSAGGASGGSGTPGGSGAAGGGPHGQ